MLGISFPKRIIFVRLFCTQKLQIEGPLLTHVGQRRISAEKKKIQTLLVRILKSVFDLVCSSFEIRCIGPYGFSTLNFELCAGKRHIVAYCNAEQDAATRCNTLQHTATHCNTILGIWRYEDLRHVYTCVYTYI